MTQSGIRAFVAVDVPDEARDALEMLQDDLPVGRLMAPETLHLTLAFLGDQPGTMLEAVHEALGEVAAEPFPLVLHGVEVFGGKSPKVLWVGARAQTALGALRERVRRAVAGAGVELPRARFRPHVTLARFNGTLRGDEADKLRGFLAHHADFGVGPFTVDRFYLYRSVLHREGAVHEVLAEYPLPCGP